ncbi:glycoside hydrolase family 2, partial [bacterium]
GFVGEFMSYGSEAEEIGGEFWTEGSLGDVELRDASSAAHVYGKPVVHAEAWTSGGPLWALDPWALKRRGDWAATEGINHFVMHVTIHQPSERTPGVSTWFGTEFNRHNTWFPRSADWIDSIRREHFLLQQGRYVADVAYFIGEDAPKMTGIRRPALPAGYSFDYIDARSILSRLKVVDRRLVLPNGMSYRVLVLPPQSTMRPGVLRRIRALVAAGATIVGSAPTNSPSLQNYPAADVEVARLAKELWASERFGKGRVLASLEKAIDLPPDVEGLPGDRAPWIHRSTPEGEIYFITNQSDEPMRASPTFRVAGRQPELWDAVENSRRDLPEFRIVAGRTTVPLELAPRGSAFVVFRRTATADGRGTNFPPPTTSTPLEGAWNVAFDPQWGGPASVTFDRLLDWTKRPEEGIRYYSGTAVYAKDFEATAAQGRVYLDLGEIHSMGRVRLNGRDVGLVWCAPWRIDVTKAVRAGTNHLEIEVTNTWQNRLIGDLNRPESERKTSATVVPFQPGSGLLPAGLIGPVRLLTMP